MKHCLIAVIFVAGLISGAYLSRPAAAQAQAQTLVHLTYIHTGAHESKSVPGEVIGFACPENTACYVLSR